MRTLSPATRHFARHYAEMVAAIVPRHGGPRHAGRGAPAAERRDGRVDVPADVRRHRPACTGLLTDTGALMGIEHTAMLPAMLVAMLLRADENTGAHHDHLAQQVAA